MNKLIAAPLAIVALAVPSVAAAPQFQGTAPIAYMEDLSSGAVLYQRDADRRMPPASMAKMMTVYVAFDMIKKGELKLDQTFTVRPETWQRWHGPQAGSTMFLSTGESVSVENLLKGIVTLSGHDACVVLAEGISGTEQTFTDRMNQQAQKLGLTNDDVDYISFDHLHVQDVRMIVGSDSVIEGETEPRKPLFPNAKLLVHRKELGTFESIHPMQWAWYVENGRNGVPADKLEIFDGDVELGVGVSLLWTPGHTDGNHSLVVNTPDGVWVSSENGMAPDSWQPEHSKIPGIKSTAKFYGREVVLNANTLEDTLDQYDSMVKEKTMASPSPRDPKWLQIIPSSECSTYKRQWPIIPSFTHGGLDYGTIQAPKDTVPERG